MLKSYQLLAASASASASASAATPATPATPPPAPATVPASSPIPLAGIGSPEKDLARTNSFTVGELLRSGVARIVFGDLSQQEINRGTQGAVSRADVEMRIAGGEVKKLPCAVKRPFKLPPPRFAPGAGVVARREESLKDEFAIHSDATFADKSSEDSNLLKLMTVYQDGGQRYAILPLCQISLHQYLPTLHAIEDRELKTAICVHIIYDVLKGLSTLHGRGFIHRDIKPSNIALLHGRWCVIDFGLTIPVDTPCAPGGTPAFLHPAAALGRTGHFLDVFAAGLVLGCLLDPAYLGTLNMVERARRYETFCRTPYTPPSPEETVMDLGALSPDAICMQMQKLMHKMTVLGEEHIPSAREMYQDFVRLSQHIMRVAPGIKDRLQAQYRAIETPPPMVSPTRGGMFGHSLGILGTTEVVEPPCPSSLEPAVVP